MTLSKFCHYVATMKELEWWGCHGRWWKLDTFTRFHTQCSSVTDGQTDRAAVEVTYW